MPQTTPLGPTGAAIANNFTRAITESLRYDDETAHAGLVLVVGVEVLVDFARVLYADPAHVLDVLRETLIQRPLIPLNPAMQQLADSVRAAERAQSTNQEPAT